MEGDVERSVDDNLSSTYTSVTRTVGDFGQEIHDGISGDGDSQQKDYENASDMVSQVISKVVANYRGRRNEEYETARKQKRGI